MSEQGSTTETTSPTTPGVVPVDSVQVCPNCETAIVGKYCPSCGQRNDRLRLSSAAMLKDFLEAVLKVDKKLLTTVRSVVVPGQLTIDYLEGKRARYPRPLSLFFICAGLYFLAWSRVPHDPVKDGLRMGFAQAKFDVKDREGESALAEALRHPDRLEQLSNDLQSPRGQFLQVFALATALVVTTRKRRLLWSEQLVFSLHLQAVSSLLMAAVLTLGVDPNVGYGLGFAYDLIAFGRLFRFGWWGTAWRYSATLVLVGLLSGLLMVPLFVLYTMRA